MCIVNVTLAGVIGTRQRKMKFQSKNLSIVLKARRLRGDYTGDVLEVLSWIKLYKEDEDFSSFVRLAATEPFYGFTVSWKDHIVPPMILELFWGKYV